MKNYLADISRFISWYERTYPKKFTPNEITYPLIQAYLAHLKKSSSNNGDKSLSYRSFERHTASLKRFFSTLHEQRVIVSNPIKHTASQDSTGKLLAKIHNQSYLKELKAYKDYLYRNNASRVTIKNYFLDVKHFLSWLESVVKLTSSNNLYNFITSQTIESYKERLLNIREFSPVSINRKLSALRKFINYLNEENLIGQAQSISLNEISNIKNPTQNPADLNLFLPDITEVNDIYVGKKKSRVAMFRLFSTLKQTIAFSLDLVLILPLVNAWQKAQYKLYKTLGISIFRSVAQKGIKATSSPHIPIDNLILNGIALGNKSVSIKPELPRINNISKRFYDPLNISIASLPVHKRFYHILRHKRPEWYVKYHQNPISHYLHFALLLAFVMILAYWLNFNLFLSPTSREPVFASLPLSPPRFLSFKGKLTDDANNPILKESTLRFSLYRDEFASGSALLWQEVLSVTPDEDGNFYALLGRNTPLEDRILKDNTDIYLGVTQGQTAEMTPRQRIATSGLASDSQSIDGLTPITSSNDYKNTLLALDSSGNLSISGAQGPKFQATEGSFTLSGESMILQTNTGSGGSIVINPDGNGFVDLQKPLQNTSENNNLPEALGSVEVNDTFSVLATSSAIAALNLRQDGTGMLISASSSGTARFTLDYLGNAMIQGSLSLNGNSLTSNQTSFSFLPDNVINLSIGSSSTELTLGSFAGNTTVRNNLLTQGNVTLGQNTDDNIYLKGRIASHVLASESGKIDLGSAQNSFNNAYLTNLFLSPSATTSGFLHKNGNNISFLNQADSLLLGGSSVNTALIKLAGVSGQDSFINAGKVGIGVTNPLTDSLQVYGDIRVGTSSTDGCLKRYDGTAIAGTCSSDIRLKKDIKTIDDVLVKLTSLKPVKFSMRDSEFPEYNFKEGISYGLIAQEVEQLFPDLVVTDRNGYKMVKYGPELTMLTIAGIKELNNKLNNLSSLTQENLINTNGDLLISKTEEGYKLSDTDGNFLTNIQNVSKALIGNLSVGLITANEAVIDNLAVATENLTINGLTLRKYILSLIDETLLNNKSGIKTPLIAAEQLNTDLISPLADDSEIAVKLNKTELSILNSKSASASAVTSFDNLGNATLSGNLKAKNIEAHDASISGTLRAGKIIADDIEGLNDVLATFSAKQNTASTAATITNIYNIYNNSSNSAQTDQQLTPTPAISPTILAENSPIASNSGVINSEFLNLNSEIADDFMPLASYSAALSYVPNMSADFATINQGLMVLGYTSVVDLSASDQISINGNFILSENSINVLGAALEIQPLKQGNIRFMGGLMTLDTKGNLEVFGDANFANDVTIKGKLSTKIIAPVPGSDLIIQLPGFETDSQSVINNASLASLQTLNESKFVVKNASGSGVLSVNNLGDLIASGAASFKDIAVSSLNIVRGASADTSAIDTIASGSAGIGTITRGYTTRTIYSPYVTENSLIYITPRSAPVQAGSQTATSVPYLSRQVPEDSSYNIKGSFTVQIPSISSEDILFNWWIIN